MNTGPNARGEVLIVGKAALTLGGRDTWTCQVE